MVLIDFPDYSFNNKSSLVVYFENCNFKCKDCDYKKSLQVKNLKEIDLYNLEKFIIDNYYFIDNIIITGGEPTIDEHTLNKIINLAHKYHKDCILYTNLLNIDNYIIDKIDKIVVDVKGNNVEEIMKNTNISFNNAIKLYGLYIKYKSCNNFIWRIPNNINCKIDFKNREYYNKQNI